MSDLSEFLRWQQTKKIDARIMDEISDEYKELLEDLWGDMELCQYEMEKPYDDDTEHYSTMQMRYGIYVANDAILHLEKFIKNTRKLLVK